MRKACVGQLRAYVRSVAPSDTRRRSMNISCEIQIVEAEPTESGPQAVARVIEPNGDIHVVRCLCRVDGTTDVGEPSEKRMMPYLTRRYGPRLIAELRNATLRAIQ